MSKIKAVDKTRLIIAKNGMIFLENKSETKIKIKVNIALQMYSSDLATNIYNLSVNDFEVFYRSQYKYKIRDRDTGEEIGKLRVSWSKWSVYPKERIVFQGKAKEE